MEGQWRIGRELEENWRRIGGELKENWMIIGRALEENWMRIGGELEDIRTEFGDIYGHGRMGGAIGW